MKIDNKKKEEFCYRIYQTIREDPSILFTDFHQAVVISTSELGLDATHLDTIH